MADSFFDDLSASEQDKYCMLSELDRISKVLLHTDDFDKMMHDVLGVVLDVFQCDRAWFLFPCDPDSPTWRVPMERTKPEYPGAMAQGVDVPMSPVVKAVFQECLATNLPVAYDIERKRPLADGTKVYEPFRVLAQISKVIRPRVGKPWLFGIHQCSHLRIWTDWEITLFEEIGNRLSEALSLYLFHQSNIEKEERYHAIVEDQTDLISRWTDDGILSFVNAAYCAQAEKTESELIGSSFFDLIPAEEHAGIQEKIRSLTVENPIKTDIHPSYKSDDSITWQQWIDRGFFDASGKLVEVQSVGRDITDIMKKEEALQRQLAFEKLVSKISKRFINYGSQELDDGINEALKEIGTFLGTERCIIFQLMEDFTVCRQTHEWYAPGLSSNHDELQNLQVKDHSWWLKELMKGEVVSVPDVRKLPDEAKASRDKLLSLGRISILHVPLLFKDKLLGMVSISSSKPILEPAPDDTILLKIAGQTFVNALDRQRTERDRNNLIKELELKNRELEQFTYTVSHDLKAPLITINGFVTALEEDIEQQNHDAVAVDLNYISSAATKMEQLLDELLSLSRIGRIENQPTIVSMENVIQTVLQTLRPFIEKKKITVSQPQPFPEVWGDRIRFECVVKNLLQNAIKFCPDNGKGIIELDFEVKEADNEVEFRVSDNGLGIEPQFQKKIFGLFEKLDINSEGTGVGLALVMRVIEHYHGSIRVESEGEWKGTTFFFTLPIKGKSS